MAKEKKEKKSWDRSDYVEVKDRITEFLQHYPDGLIQTHVAHVDGPEVIVEARVYKTPEDVQRGAYTSDLAQEVAGRNYINETSHVENCSTSAIGRALANMGYSLSKKRPSREEMLKVARQQKEMEEFIEFITDNIGTVADDFQIPINGDEVVLKDYARENWEDIQEQFKLARLIVEAVEKATGVEFRPIPE